jgi:hypothetical protein
MQYIQPFEFLSHIDPSFPLPYGTLVVLLLDDAFHFLPENMKF